jgi:hypothetical protein
MSILPSLGLLLIIALGYIIFRQKISDYNTKFTSMFSLLSAMTDEINKLKVMIKYGHFTPIEVSEDPVEDEYDGDDSDDQSYNDENDDKSDDESDDDESDDDESDNDQDNIDEDNDDGDNNDESDKNEENDNDIPNSMKLQANDDNEIASTVIKNEVIEKEIYINDVENIDYSKLSNKELKNLAKQRGLGGDNISKLKKQDLINILNDMTVSME